MNRGLRWTVACVCVWGLCAVGAAAQDVGSAAKKRQEKREQLKREAQQKKEQAARERKEQKEKARKEREESGPKVKESSGPRDAVKSFRRTKQSEADMPDEEPKAKAKEEPQPKERKKRDDSNLIPGEPTEIERLAGDPTTTEQMWQVLDRDMRFGLHKEAKRHLAQLLAQPDLEEKVLDLREKYGSSMLVALTIDPELREASKRLVDMANSQSQKKARDAERIKRFIGNLSKTPAEKGYAILQLRRAGAFAVPQLVAALSDKNADRLSVIDGLLNLGPDAAPAVATLLSSNDPGLIDLGIELLEQYGDKDSAAELWFVSASKDMPLNVRQRASSALSRLTRIELGKLPAAAPMLAELAEKHYQKEASFSGSESPVTVWKWSAKGPVSEQMSASAAEEYFGERYARQAIALDPANVAARVALVSLYFDKSYEKSGVENPLPATAGGIAAASLGVGPDILTAVLNKAIDEHRTAVVLGAVKALGATGRLSLLAAQNGHSPFARALDYPSRRVQFAAATAVLEMHPTEFFPFAARVVQTLTRAAEMDSKPYALVVAANTTVGREKCSILSSAGFGTELALGGRNGFDAAAQSAAFDLAILDANVTDPTIEATVVNFRNDARTAGLPIVVMFDEAKRDLAASLQKRFKRLVALPKGMDAEEFAKGVKLGLADPADKPLTAAEKTQQQAVAVEWLKRLARGEFPYIDIRPAVGAMSKLLDNPQLGPTVADALGRLPSAAIQNQLAQITLSGTQPIANRVAAALGLAQNIQMSSSGLNSETMTKLTQLFLGTDDRNLRIATARVLGAAGPTDNEIAKRIMEYRSLTPDDLRPAAPEPKAASDADADLKKQPAEADEKPAKKAEEKKPAAKKKSFFDDN